MGQKGVDAKVQVKNADNNGAWNELEVVYDQTTTFSPQLLENTSFGDESPDQIKGLIEATSELTFRVESSDSAAVADIRSAALDLNASDEEIEIEISPDGNTSSGPTDVIAFTAMPSDYEVSGSVGSPQERTTTLELSNGVKPQINSTFST
jgi:hypothetical protein